MNIIKKLDKQIKNIGWILVFYFVMAIMVLPAVIYAQKHKLEVPIYVQAMIVLIASVACQIMRRKPLNELFGRLGYKWVKDLCIGLLTGFSIMIMPAIFLYITGCIGWTKNTISIEALFSIIGVFASVAIAEELLFRGFMFQRMVDAFGVWVAQIIGAAYFLLIHMDNPELNNGTHILAYINIFFASIMFGLAYLKTNSLAMPIGIHFMANGTQGALLGFGVSGNLEKGILSPRFLVQTDWLTGGSFGLEASLPGLLMVIFTIILLLKWKPSNISGNLTMFSGFTNRKLKTMIGRLNKK